METACKEYDKEKGNWKDAWFDFDHRDVMSIIRIDDKSIFVLTKNWSYDTGIYNLDDHSRVNISVPKGWTNKHLLKMEVKSAVRIVINEDKTPMDFELLVVGTYRNETGKVVL
jgi:hypothetical protein